MTLRIIIKQNIMSLRVIEGDNQIEFLKSTLYIIFEDIKLIFILDKKKNRSLHGDTIFFKKKTYHGIYLCTFVKR